MSDLPLEGVKELSTEIGKDGTIAYSLSETIRLNYVDHSLFINQGEKTKRILQRYAIPYELPSTLETAIMNYLEHHKLVDNTGNLRSYCKQLGAKNNEGITYDNLKFLNSSEVPTRYKGYFYYVDGYYFWLNKGIIHCGFSGVELDVPNKQDSGYAIVSKLVDGGVIKFDPRIMTTFLSLSEYKLGTIFMDVNKFINTRKEGNLQVSIEIYKHLLEPLYK